MKKEREEEGRVRKEGKKGGRQAGRIIQSFTPESYSVVGLMTLSWETFQKELLAYMLPKG